MADSKKHENNGKQRQGALTTVMSEAVPLSDACQLALTQTELNHVLGRFSDIVYQTNRDGIVMMVSDACERILGYKAIDIIGHSIADFYCDQEERLRLLNGMLDDGVHDREIVAALIHKDGQAVWVSTNVHLVFDIQGAFLGSQGIARDITERKRQEALLQASELQYRTLYEMTNDAVMLLDDKGFFDCNAATVRLFGCHSTAEFCSMHPADLSPEYQLDHRLSSKLAAERIEFALAHGSNRFEWLHKRADNDAMFHADVQLNRMNVNGRTILQAVVRDITRLKEEEARVQQLAFYDPLTGLPNRRLLDIKLEQLIAECKRYKCLGALIFLDLDYFKVLNDQHGHIAGDRLLVQVADRLRSQLREVDTLVRFGGDEFIALLGQLGSSEVHANEQALMVAEKLRVQMDRRFRIQVGDVSGQCINFQSGASFGVQLISGSNLDAEVILTSADRAMYQAKRGGRNQIISNGIEPHS